MKKVRKTFAIILLALMLPMWLFQMGVRNLMSFESFVDFTEMVEANIDIQMFRFDEVYNAGRFLASLAGFAKFFESLIIPLCLVAGIIIVKNPNKRKITMIPGCILLSIVLFNLVCIIAGSIINNIEIIDTTVDLLYYQNVKVNVVNPVINPASATINSVLLSIPATGFLTCGILDIMYLKKNPEAASKIPMDLRRKKACIFYWMSAISVVALLLIASFVSASFNVATISWIFRYFWQGYIVFIIAAIVFYVFGKNTDPTPKKIKPPKTAPVQVSIQQTSSADELKKYKELLDAGIITQEEFDAKKKQLLGL